MTADVKTRIKAYYALGLFTLIGFIGGSFYDLMFGCIYTLTVFALIIAGAELEIYIQKKKKKVES